MSHVASRSEYAAEWLWITTRRPARLPVLVLITRSSTVTPAKLWEKCLGRLEEAGYFQSPLRVYSVEKRLIVGV